MSDQDGFAAFMAEQQGAVVERLSRGQQVSGKVSHISADSVFVALGARADGRVPRAELLGRDGELRVALGDELSATVVDPNAPEGPLLAVALGKDQSIDLQGLEFALESRTPVQVRFSRAVKGGLEAEMQGARAFCPASQLDTTYVADLTSFVGQEALVLVLEIKNDGRSIVVSRRAALERERAAAAEVARAKLTVGAQIEGVVKALKPYGAFVDLGGVEGLLHISEVSAGRVERLEDVLTPGERVQVTVLALADGEQGNRIRLSMRDRNAESQDNSRPLPSRNEVLKGVVARLLPHGVIVQTERGEGFVPKRELDLPVGADHRRAVPVGHEMEVVVLDGAPGKLRFSANKVQEVRAAQDFQAYREQQSGQGGSATSSLGAQLGRLNLGNLPKGPPPAPKQTQPPAAEPPVQQTDAAGKTRSASEARAESDGSGERFALPGTEPLRAARDRQVYKGGESGKPGAKFEPPASNNRSDHHGDQGTGGDDTSGGRRRIIRGR